MSKFSQWGLAGRDDHGPQGDRTRKAKLPSSPKEESDEYESVKGDGDEAGGDSSSSEDDGDDNDGSNDGNEEVADTDGDDDREEEEDDEEEEEEEEEEGAGRRSPVHLPFPTAPKPRTWRQGCPPSRILPMMMTPPRWTWSLAPSILCRRRPSRRPRALEEHRPHRARETAAPRPPLMVPCLNRCSAP